MNEMSGRFGSDDDALRSEDAPLLTGAGQFVDDLNIGGQAYGAFVRASVGHGILRGVDTTAALAMPGVLAVLTGADAQAAGLGDIPHDPISWQGRHGNGAGPQAGSGL